MWNKTNEGGFYANICGILYVNLTYTERHIRRHLSRLAVMVLQVTLKVTLYKTKHIIMIKLIWCVNDNPNWGQAYATIRLTINSPTILFPEIYDGFSANWLIWDCRSYRQLRCFVYDKKELARLNLFVLMVFQIVVRRM